MRYDKNINDLKELLNAVKSYTRSSTIESMDEVETTIDLLALILDHIDQFSIPEDINDLGEILSIKSSREGNYVITTKSRSYYPERSVRITSDFINFYDVMSPNISNTLLKDELLFRMHGMYETNRLLSSALLNELVETISGEDLEDSVISDVRVYKSKDDYQHYGILFNLSGGDRSLFATLVLD